MRILLPNQGPSTRSFLGILFKAQSDLELVGEPSEVSQLASDVKTHNPDVVILDYDLLGEQVDSLLEMVKSLDHCPVVVGMSVRAEKRQTVIDTGADGFAYMGDPPECLLSAIRTAFNQRSEQHK